MKLKKTFESIFTISFLMIAIFSSCKKNDNLTTSLNAKFSEKKLQNHRWYYFTKDNFLPITEVKNIPEVFDKPWSQATRISKAIQSGQNSIFAVNRLGFLLFDSNTNDIKLFKDETIFSNSTVDSLFILNDKTIFSVYHNDFFSETKIKNTNTFMYQFKIDNGIFYPLLEKKQLNLSNDAQIISLVHKDNVFFANIKSYENEKIIFSYIKFPVGLISKDFSAQIESIGCDVFRNLLMPKSFNEAPLRLKKLLERLPSTLNFQIDCKLNDENTVACFINHNLDEEATNTFPVVCKAILQDNFSIAIFSDGTTFFAGSLPEKYILNSGETIAFRLPKLPKNFFYTEIAVCKNILVCGFEEKEFFKIRRTGFITVDLEEILY
ncbi:MAG: hypothetical protein GX220_01180 [Treponema sp.]|nr:hypothetical protein [Treponema sp.]